MFDGQFFPGQRVQFKSDGAIRGPWHKASMQEVINRQGLTSGLKLCLDAGDSASLPSASTKWLDTSGNGYDFFRGTTAGSDATDPTINGTPNARTSAEYLSFDGGDYLRYDTTNETWMQNIHKNNAQWAFAGWVWPPSFATTQRFAGTRAQVTTTIGFALTIETTGLFAASIAKGVAPIGSYMGNAQSLNAAEWNFVAVSVDEAVGANGAVVQVNGAQDLVNSAITSPSASNATYTMEIGAAGNGLGVVASTFRIASFSMWEGVVLSAAQLSAIYAATRSRFGV